MEKEIPSKQVKLIKLIKRTKMAKQAGLEEIAPAKRTRPQLTKPVEYYSWVEGGEYLGSQSYTLPNNTKFPDWIFKKYNEYQLSEAYESNCDELEKGRGNKGKQVEDIFPYQKFVRDYMSYETPYRGILLYYGLGAGKTRAALEIARAYREDLDYKVIFISPAGLVDNFVDEMGKWGMIPEDESQRIISLKTRKSRVENLGKFGYYIVSYDAPNKGAQLQLALESDEKSKPRLRNKVIIIDEAHNMAQFIHNGLNQRQNKAKRDRAQEFYDILYGATNCRFIMLSGTPMINIPSEMAILFNILRGPIRFRPQDNPSPKVLKQNVPSSVKSDTKYHSVFPVDKDEFDEIFVDWKALTIPPGKNQLFKQRIMGLVAYYSGARGDVYPDIVDEGGVIKVSGQNPWTLVLVPMSEFQLIAYETIRQIEREEIPKKEPGATKTTKTAKTTRTTKTIGPNLEQEIQGVLGETEDKIDSTFRIKSRQISNFALPLELEDIRPQSISEDPEGLKELYTALDLEEGKDLFKKENLEIYSAKMNEMLNQIEKARKDPKTDGNVLVYSNFRSIEGIEIFARVLEHNGYEYFNPTNPSLPLVSQARPKFAILGKDYRTGDDNTTKILKLFNSEENKNGDIIKIVLGTSNISEGISLFNIRLVLIMEPHWNMVRINQVIGRARRICSHRKLPRDKWNFQVYVYLSVIPEKCKNRTPDVVSTDQVLYEIADRKEQVKQQFIHLIKEAAVDCMLNATHNQNLEQDPPVRCLTFPESDELVYSYFPNIEDDLGRGVRAIAGVEEAVLWAPFKDIPHPGFTDKATEKPRFAVVVQPNTGLKQGVKIRLKEEGPDSPIYVGRALYDHAQLEHAGKFVLKGYVVQGKPVWPPIVPGKVEIVEEYY